MESTGIPEMFAVGHSKAVGAVKIGARTEIDILVSGRIEDCIDACLWRNIDRWSNNSRF